MSKRYTTKQDIYGDWAVFKYDLLICGNIPDKAIAEIFCKELNKLAEENSSWLRTASRLDTVMHEDRTYIEKLLDENKQLKKQNEELKDENAILKQVLTRLVEAFNDSISDKSPVRDLIK